MWPRALFHMKQGEQVLKTNLNKPVFTFCTEMMSPIDIELPRASGECPSFSQTRTA